MSDFFVKLAWLTFFSFKSALIAVPSISELQLKLNDLRKQDHALGQQKKEVQKQIHQTQADIRIVEGAETFDAAVKSLKFQHPKAPRAVLIYSRTQGFRHVWRSGHETSRHLDIGAWNSGLRPGTQNRRTR